MAVLEAAPTSRFPAETDSNSPSAWLLARGRALLVLFNSASTPMLSVGGSLERRTLVGAVAFDNHINGARWMEAVLPDSAGRLYGFYHNEPTGACVNDASKTAPRIGAARSLDGGLSWTDLGLILEAPPVAPDCRTPNTYFAGGVGDFSVILDGTGTDLYILFSTYGPDPAPQGVAAARMLWGDRDDPQGQVSIWSDGVWRYPQAFEDRWVYPAATPFLPAHTSWHNPRGGVDAFWGPSVHWNTFLNRYVILLNRANDAAWTQEGIYLSSTTTIEDPTSWSVPQKLLDGGRWYPQVVGLETGSGTDKLAGERARFFMAGTSDHEIVFQRRSGVAAPR